MTDTQTLVPTEATPAQNEAPTHRAPSPNSPSLDSPSLYLNRELSWLEFNERVLGEARDPSHPLLERVKFVAIFHTNLDEWYMVRISGFQQQVSEGMTDVTPDGMTSAQQLAVIRSRVGPLLSEASTFFRNTRQPELRQAGICLTPYAELSRDQQKSLR